MIFTLRRSEIDINIRLFLRSEISSSVIRSYGGAMSLEWLPRWLMTENIKNQSAIAQRVKHMLILLAGVETKRQNTMSKSDREHFIFESYERWCQLLRTRYPKAVIHGYMAHTTGERTTKIDGVHMYRNFQEGLRTFHNNWNTVWQKVFSGQISG